MATRLGPRWPLLARLPSPSQAWGELVRAGRLFALRVVNVGDMVPLLPYDVPLYNTVGLPTPSHGLPLLRAVRRHTGVVGMVRVAGGAQLLTLRAAARQVHAIEPRLLLDPTQGAAKPLALAPHAPADDKDLRRFVPDPTSHTMHSGLLGAEVRAVVLALVRPRALCVVQERELGPRVLRPLLDGPRVSGRSRRGASVPSRMISSGRSRCRS
eukprot:7263905-Prymnesium_polylepis.1